MTYRRNPLKESPHKGVSGVVRFYQHINGEPAMILARNSFGRGCAYVVCLSAAYKYVDTTYLIAEAFQCARVLGLSPPTRSEVNALADMILDGLDDLVATPPDDQKEPVTGEGKATIGGQIFSFEV